MKKPVIICVDDEKIVLDSLKKELLQVLSNEYIIEIAESGEEALEIIEDLIADKIECPLIISDFIMPEMKGDELLIEAYSILPKCKSILLTGQATMEGVTNAVNNANLYRYMAKPWDKEDLLMTIKEALKIYYNEKELELKQKELKEAFDELKKLDKSKSYFLGLLSHELNTPLIGINGNTKLIQAFTDDPEILESCDEILKSEARLRGFSDISLLITRLQVDQYKMNHTEETVSSLIESAVGFVYQKAKDKSINIEIEHIDDDFVIKCDFGLIIKAISIVLENAIVYPHASSVIYVKSTKNSIYIQDQGPGFPSDRINNIFDMFESDDLMSHGEGYGLGLTAAKMIMDAHDFDILLENNQIGARVELKFK